MDLEENSPEQAQPAQQSEGVQQGMASAEGKAGIDV